MDDHVQRLFSGQHGLATRAQLYASGMTRGQVDGQIRRGRLFCPAPGIVSAVGVPETPEREAMLAVLRGGEGARMIGPRALSMLGIRGFNRQDAFGILVNPRRNLRCLDDLAAFGDPVMDDGTMHVGSIPLPRPPRLMIEMARFETVDGLRAAVDAGAWAGRPTRPALARAALALPQRYVPAARVRELVRTGALDLDSEPERRLVAMLGQQFGSVETQVWVTPRRRVDVLLRRHGVALEYDGADHRGARGRQRDEARDAEIRAVGFEPIHLQHEDLLDPAALLVRVAAAIAEVSRRRDLSPGSASAAS